MDRLGNHVHLTLPPEEDDGDIEYKWDLATIKDYKHHKITSQMRWRVRESSDIGSALYVLGIHDNGHLTGLCLENLIATYLNLMDSARQIGMYTCIRLFKNISGTDRYWAVLQVFDRQQPCKTHPFQNYTDELVPHIPEHNIPEYLTNT